MQEKNYGELRGFTPGEFFIVILWDIFQIIGEHRSWAFASLGGMTGQQLDLKSQSE